MSYTGTTRVTGLSSGMDIDGLVEKMMKAESSKYNNLQRKSTKLQWQQEAYRSIISKLQSFQDKWFGNSSSSTNFRYSVAFQNFKNTVMSGDTESKAITINSSRSSASFDVKVNKLATADTYTSSQMSREMASSKSLDDVAATITEDMPLQFAANLDGTSKIIKVTRDEFDSASGGTDGEKLKNLLNEKLKSAFGTDGSGSQKVEVTDSSKGTFQFKVNADGGSGHVLTLNESGARDAQSVTSEKFDIEELKKDPKEYTFSVNGKSILVKVDANETNDSLIEKINTALSDSGFSGVSASLVTETVDGQKEYKIKFTNSSADTDIMVSTGTLVSFEGENQGKSLTHTGSLADMGFVSGDSTSMVSSNSTVGGLLEIGDSEEYTLKINGTDVTLTGKDSLNEMMKKISTGTGVTMSYNSVTKVFKLEANETGAVNQITFDKNASDLMGKIGIDTSSEANHTVKAQDAELEIDGVKTTRSSNDVDLDGMKITLNSVTDGVVTVGSTYDSDAMVDKIKEFVKEYNELIEGLQTEVKTARSKSGTKGNYSYYEPLLDEEKKEMSEDEIEKWETEAKKGLLYNDSIISGLLSNMRSALYSGVTTSDGTKISLYQIGVTTTSDYTKGGVLEVDETKLKEAIENNGNAIQELFTQTKTGLGDKMNEILKGAVGSTGSLRNKAGIVGTASVSENALSKQISALNDQIEKELSRLASKENHYYQLFSAMESAVNNSNSQLDAIYSMLA